jgi:hypothetical protein
MNQWMNFLTSPIPWMTLVCAYRWTSGGMRGGQVKGEEPRMHARSENAREWDRSLPRGARGRVRGDLRGVLPPRGGRKRRRSPTPCARPAGSAGGCMGLECLTALMCRRNLTIHARQRGE